MGSTRSRGLYCVKGLSLGAAGVKKGRCFSNSLLSSEPDLTEMLVAILPEVDEDEDERRGEPKPIEPLAMRFMISFCRPTKAPAKMKRILSVRTL